MSDIDISLLRADIVDRVDNLVVSQQISESLRQKLTATKRITRSINNALYKFVATKDPATLHSFQENVALQADQDVGNQGVINGVTTYNWPSGAFTARINGGIVKIIVNGVEKYFDPATSTPLDSLVRQANNTLYGSDHPVFHVDMQSMRLYAAEGVALGARIIKHPDLVTDDDKYGEGVEAPGDIPISDAYMGQLVELSVMEILVSAQQAQQVPSTDQAEE